MVSQLIANFNQSYVVIKLRLWKVTEEHKFELFKDTAVVFKNLRVVLIWNTPIPPAPDVFVRGYIFCAEVESLETGEHKERATYQSSVKHDSFRDNPVNSIVHFRWLPPEGKKDLKANSEDNECMDGGPEYEAYEEPDVPSAHTGANPRAVVVMHLNAAPASAAVKSPWRPKHVAAPAVGQLVLSVFVV